VEDLRVEMSATLSQYRDFIASPIWRDIETEIRVWLTGLHAQLEVTTEPCELYRLQGRAQALQEVLQLPSTFIDALS
jgi:hypothetical protein